ncbi:MAG TPA: subclass B2 metallo-beta-lactamase [Terracidiphilus sp.]|jgi:metallo-beta-lactamase class B|nr:subclass B2 metallo-beta-lactamase [Terracidiphilus sp.]
MHRVLGALLFLLIGVSAVRAEKSKPVMRLSKLTGPIYLVEDEHYVATNSLVYIGPESVTVVGATWTPDTAKLLAGQIRKLTSRPIREVIDTSPDPEWSGGNAYWKRIGAQIVAHQVTNDFLRSHWTAAVAACRKNNPTYPDLPLVLPTRVLQSDFNLQHGDVRVFYLGPSHTPADVFVYFPKEKVLDAGSILKENLGNMAKADVKEYPTTLNRLKALDLPIRMIISGHWSAVHGPELVDHYLDLLEKNR